jgi:hypothetical protein
MDTIGDAWALAAIGSARREMLTERHEISVNKNPHAGL